MPTIISSTANLVQASGISNSTRQVQTGVPTSIADLIFTDPPSASNTLVSTDSPSMSSDLVQDGGISNEGFIVTPSPTITSLDYKFIVYEPDFSRSATLVGVVGTTGTVERFFDRSPFFFTPSEIDPNTLRDLSEVQQFLIYSTASIVSYENVLSTSSSAKLITAKGEIFENLNEPINLLDNPSFERDLSGWSVVKADPSDVATVVTTQPGGVGFNDAAPVSPINGSRMLYMARSQATGSLRVTQDRQLGATYPSSLVEGISFAICPDASPNASFYAIVDFQFFLDGNKQYDIIYRFSGGNDPTPLASGISISPLDSITLSSPTPDIFNVYSRDFQTDSGKTAFSFNSISAHIVIDRIAAQYDVLFDDFQVNLNLPSEELRQTANLAHILTANPTTSGLPFTVSGSTTITSEDQTGPYFADLVPGSGTFFNNPNTNVTVYFRDDGSAINQGSINLWIDSQQVVSSGVTVTGVLWPNIQKTIVSPGNTRFILDRSSDFALGATVTISGSASDTETNSFVDAYTFRVWDYTSLPATLTSSADADAPAITLVSPLDSATNVSPNTDIVWSVIDAATGVDPASVRLYLNGILRVNAASSVISGTLSSTGNSSSGFTYTYNPSEAFGLGQLVSGTLEASDVSGNANSVPFSFTTTATDTLFIQNFFLSTGASVSLTSDTNIEVDVVDSVYGINTSGTYLTINGSLPSGLTTSGISGGIRFSVPAQPLINFRTDLQILVHAENLFPGSYPVVKEQVFSLRAGYKVDWYNRDPEAFETTFPYITNIPVLVDVYNFAKKGAQGSLFYRFLTEDQPRADLPATITSNIVTADLPAAVVSDNPFFEYGKTIVLEIEADDLEGNQLRFTHVFTIEQNPN